ncbi:hypothetical protein M1N69_04945, partial [Thermodesulfovibrionales bacterium]|nr:hypothetical protein [Thermodesulfovibrionales bacterium]
PSPTLFIGRRRHRSHDLCIDKLVKRRHSRLSGILLKDSERILNPRQGSPTSADKLRAGSVGMTEKCFLRLFTTSAYI